MQPELPPIDEMLAVLKKAYESGPKWREKDYQSPDGLIIPVKALPNVTSTARMNQARIEELAAFRDRSYQRIICNLPSLYWDALNLLEDDRQLQRLTSDKEKLDQLSNTELVRLQPVITTSFVETSKKCK